MEARKRATPREMDVESNRIEMGHDGPTTPYTGMPKELPEAAAAAAAAGGGEGIVAYGTNAVVKEDSHARSLAKGFTWRFVASGTTIVIAKIVTGETTVAFQIGFFEFFAKILIYYVHERIWAKIRL